MEFRLKNRDGSLSNTKKVGDAIAWSCNKAFYPKDNFKSSWEALGLPKEIPGDYTRQEIFKRVVQEMKGTGGSSYVAEFEREGQAIVKYFSLTLDENEKAKVEERGTVWWDEANDMLRSDNSDVELIFRQKMVEMSGKYLQRDLTRYFNALCKKYHSVPLRQAGGMYFIPATAGDLVANLKAFFKDIDGGKFTLIEIPATIDSQETIKESFVDALGIQLKKLKKKWDAIVAASKKMSPTVFGTSLEEIGELTDELKIYKEITEENLRESADILVAYQKAAKEFMVTGKLPELANCGEEVQEDIL